MRATEYAARMEGIRNVYIVVGKPHRKRLLWTCSSSWKDAIKVNLKEIEVEGVNRIHLVLDSDQRRASVITEMNLLVPQKQGFS
jgi:cephalosporin hydroxylase